MATRDVRRRGARIEDAGDLAKNCFSSNHVDSMKDWIRENLSEPDDRLHLVAELDGEVIGSATLYREQGSLSRHIGSIRAVVVDHRHQRKGIAPA